MIRRYRRLPHRLRKRTAARHRRGVLLLVILSILVLFVLIAVTFVLTSSQAASSSRSADKAEEHRPDPEALLNAAMLQVLVGSDNGNSGIWGHSLLEDYYGNHWFQGKLSGGANAALNTSGQFVEFTYSLESQGDPNSTANTSTANYFRGCVLTLLDEPAAGPPPATRPRCRSRKTAS